MNRPEILGEFSDQTIVKGKRGKRLRPPPSAAELSSNSSPAASSVIDDEDMANCLILLARGGLRTVADYNCKTCRRNFPSFQALGGHRASHKKPKQAVVDDRKKSPPGKIGLLKVEDKLMKIHECSVCGSQFGSGQALGGHMRRHRSVINGSRPVSASIDEKVKSVFALDLDLNLPAPIEEDSGGEFPSNQQPVIAFSAAALVDCHY